MTAFAHFADPSHKSVSRCIAYSLHLAPRDGLAAFLPLIPIFRRKLDRHRRQGLAWAAGMACDQEEFAGIAEAILGAPETRAGWPMVPFEDVVSEASFWADHASEDELRAYAAVCLSRLADSERRAA